MIRFTLILLLWAANACALETNQTEPLAGAYFSGNRLHFQAKSTGCTDSDSFEIQENEQGTFTEMSVIRTKPDRCRRKARFLWLSLPVTTNKHPIVINNRFVTPQ